MAWRCLRRASWAVSSCRDLSCAVFEVFGGALNVLPTPEMKPKKSHAAAKMPRLIKIIFVMYITNIILLGLGIFAAAWLFFGFISGIGKTFKTPAKISNAAQLKSQRQEAVQEARRKHTQAMDDIKQKIADGTRNKY